MPESFGARLRQRRERQHVALAAIAKQTKIKLSLLEGLERDDVSQWPSGIFRRAFIRGYARAIDLEPDLVIREFLQVHPDPLEDAATEPAAVTGGDAASASGRPPTRLRCLVGSAISSLAGRRSGADRRRPLAVADPAATGCGDTVTALVTPEPDLVAAAHLCAGLGRLDEPREAAPLLEEAARILDAVGLIVWVWHPQATELRPVIAQGYSDKLLARLPRVGRETDNATAAAFRSAQTCVVKSRDLASGAVVAPMVTSGGCVGVLAIELQHGREQKESVRALATILAAQLARVVGAAASAEGADRRLA